MPSDIVSDRGSLFVSQFWRELCRALGIESRLSTAYHPQTDGQTERVNQSVEAFANKGYHPKLSITLELVQGAEVNEYASNLKELHAYLQERIQVANEVYAQYANQKRQEAPDWKEGDHVWLNMENVRTRRPMKKLDHKWTGPYSILSKIGSHAYRLDLPGDLHKIHNVFHVDRLKPHFHDKFKRQTSPPPPIFIKGETEHFVEDILDSKTQEGTLG
ncbi:retrotransposon nucleocapsid protein [Lentinula edodes]|uniref:Retrotransposon nucleocapsid protein n=1 Tax=Lentinula edodes TaxID=5353 RepID=A0A1Q3E980_LENED|nr:retrotransposon nucleocapsid protein [Lentinula edodes]